MSWWYLYLFKLLKCRLDIGPPNFPNSKLVSRCADSAQKYTLKRRIVLVKTSSKDHKHTRTSHHTGRTILNLIFFFPQNFPSSFFSTNLLFNFMKSRSFFVLSARTHTQDNLFFLNFRPLPNFVTLLFRKEHLNLRLRRSHTHLLHFFQYSYAHAAAITYIGMVSFRSITQIPRKYSKLRFSSALLREDDDFSIPNAHRNSLKFRISLE